MESKNFIYEEIEIGNHAEFEVVLMPEEVERFAALSGDFNPLHTDKEYASKTQFGKPIVHGMHLASLISRLIGMYLPGKKSLYLSQTLFFHRPVYPGDKVCVTGEVTGKSDAIKIINLRTTIKNKKGEIILDGEAKVKIL